MRIFLFLIVSEEKKTDAGLSLREIADGVQANSSPRQELNRPTWRLSPPDAAVLLPGGTPFNGERERGVTDPRANKKIAQKNTPDLLPPLKLSIMLVPVVCRELYRSNF